MKQKDILIIVAVVIVSSILAAVASKMIFKPTSRQQKAEVVEAFSPQFPDADPRFFNKYSVDPTQTIQIGDGSNAVPFKDATQ